jgi:nitrogen fixation/metabolism regulation signal transduction histidine kinase
VLTNTIHAAVEPEGVATYLEQEGSLRLCMIRILDGGGSFNAPLEPAAPILSEGIARAEPLLRDELDPEADHALRKALEATSWALALPLLADEQLVGLIAVGAKRSGDPFFSDDVDSLTTLANHAGSAVKNARLHAEAVLANEYVNNIVAAMQNGVVAVDAAGVVTRANPAAVEMLDLASDTLLKADDLPAPLRTILQQVLGDGRQQTAQEMAVSGTSSAQTLHLLCTASPLRDHADNMVGAVAVFSDVTPLKELDQERARTESLASLQRMTQAVAHEIGNPLVPIKTLTKLLPERVGNRAFAQDVSRIVSREIERIERLVARLRRVAPQADPSFSSLDFRVPMSHAVEVIQAEAAKQETRLDVLVATSPLPIVGDALELEELFLNLLTNALEAVADQPAASRLVEVSVASDGTRAVARIRDSGPGIAADVVNRLFDPFVSTKSRGSGLGLAICRRIAERHRGQLIATNGERGGAVFTLTVPLTPDRSAAAAAPSESGETPPKPIQSP